MIYVHTSEEGGKKQETVQFLQTIIIIIRNYFATLSYLMYHVSHVSYHISFFMAIHPTLHFYRSIKIFSIFLHSYAHTILLFFLFFMASFYSFNSFSNKTKNNRIKCNLNSSNEKSIYQLIKKIPAYPRLLLYFLIVKTMCSC